jgi:NADH-quinone oxidoreductase subunit H
MNLGFQLLFAFLKILIMVGFLFNVGALLTWVDRRQSAMIQDRIGPNRAVIKIPFLNIEIRAFGLIHTLADGLKFFFKEDFIPPNADKLLFGLAPILSMAPVLALIAVIPFGDVLDLHSLWSWGCVGTAAHPLALAHGQCIDAAHKIVADVSPVIYFPAVPRFGSPASVGVDLMVAPLGVGLLYVFALAGQGIIGAAIAGWSSDNKFSLMGALRAASQMVSYEVTIGLSLVGAMMLYGTVRLDDMVRWQGENSWGIFVQPIAFFVFFAASIAETKRIPFDLPEAESELVSGYFTEYSGMKFGMFYFAEYMEVATSSMLLVTIFLGGWQLPFIHRDGLSIELGTITLFHMVMPHIWVTILQVLTFFGKVLVVCSFQAFIRWTLPRFRYDQLMNIGWRVLLPLSLANIFVTGCFILGVQSASAGLQGGLKVAADLSQAGVALLITALVIRGAFGMLKPRKKALWIVGSSAERALTRGGTKETAMQA